MDSFISRIVDAARNVFGSGPVAVVGAPPQVSQLLALHGYMVSPEPLPDAEGSAAWAIAPGARQVLLAVFDPHLAPQFENCFALLAQSGVSTLLYVAHGMRSPSGARVTAEEAAFAAGYRKHAAYYRVNAYVDLELGSFPIFVPLRLAPGDVATERAELKAARMLHMDMTRETGRRSDAHMFRYQMAAWRTAPGDVVLDVGCGKGYGAWMLARGTHAQSVLGIDESEDAIAYAQRSFAGDTPGRLSYRVDDAELLSDIPASTVDFVTAFEIVEHLRHPEYFLDRCCTLLRPGGRLMLSVPNRWIDASGRDPNPYHLHVYDWQRILAEVGRFFVIERAYSQSAGGGFKASEDVRRCVEYDPSGAGVPPDGEWCLVTALKAPDVRQPPFDNGRLGRSGIPGWNLNDLAEQYTYPWAVIALGQGGRLRNWRLDNAAMRLALAEAALSWPQARPSDRAAMLAVIGYGALEALSLDAARDMVLRIAECLMQLGDDPIGTRWRISLTFLSGRLWQLLGDPTAAEAEYAACVAIDTLGFGPAIATKTVSAWREIGRLRWLAGDGEAAHKAWQAGTEVARRVFEHGTWQSVVGDPEDADEVGLFELQDVFAIAQECALYAKRSRQAESVDGMLLNSERLTKDGLAGDLLRDGALWRDIALRAMETIATARRALQD